MMFTLESVLLFPVKLKHYSSICPELYNAFVDINTKYATNKYVLVEVQCGLTVGGRLPQPGYQPYLSLGIGRYDRSLQ
jgi:hypothetical protein